MKAPVAARASSATPRWIPSRRGTHGTSRPSGARTGSSGRSSRSATRRQPHRHRHDDGRSGPGAGARRRRTSRRPAGTPRTSVRASAGGGWRPAGRSSWVHARGPRAIAWAAMVRTCADLGPHIRGPVGERVSTPQMGQVSARSGAERAKGEDPRAVDGPTREERAAAISELTVAADDFAARAQAQEACRDRATTRHWSAPPARPLGHAVADGRAAAPRPDPRARGRDGPLRGVSPGASARVLVPPRGSEDRGCGREHQEARARRRRA